MRKNIILYLNTISVVNFSSNGCLVSDAANITHHFAKSFGVEDAAGEVIGDENI